MEEDLLDGVGDVRTGERQVLEGLGEAPEVSWTNNRRPRLDGDLGMHVHQRRNQLVVHYVNSLKNIVGKLTLCEEDPIRLILYEDSQKMMEGLEILQGEFPLEG
jgi:hypothetical protein